MRGYWVQHEEVAGDMQRPQRARSKVRTIMAKVRENQFVPNTYSPPGEALAEVIEERGMTQTDLALRLGMAQKTVNEIIQGKAPLTQYTALALERVLGVPASVWNRYEADYREQLARQRDHKRLTQAKEWLGEFPLKEMIRCGYLRQRSSVEEQAEELLRFLHVASPVEWNSHRTVVQGYYRHSTTQDSDPNALGAWIQRGENLARQTSCNPFDKAKFTQVLADLRAFTSESQETFLPRLTEACRACGVAVALVPALPKAKVCGFTRWISSDKALLQLSDRYKRADIFWFTFYHEAGHILKHGKKEIFIEFDLHTLNEKETQADQFAADLLIPPTQFAQIASDKPFGRDKIIRWSRKIGVAPHIIVGRLRRENLLEHSHLSDLLPKIDLTAAHVPLEDLDMPKPTLAEVFAGRTGGVHGGGKAWSEETGGAFSNEMVNQYEVSPEELPA